MSLPVVEFYRERERAESFGSVAAHYDRYRPSFPEALIDDLAARWPASVLDVATGTGKVAVALASRGLDVVGVEVDARMAEVARKKGARVDVARFEQWDDAGRRFDLVTFGDAWHWIEPEAGLAKVAKVLRAGGTFARFFNNMVLDDDVLAVLADVYAALAPSARLYGQPLPMSADELFTAGDWVRATDTFGAGETKVYSWEQSYRADEWAQFIATISDHQRLGEEPLAKLQHAVGDALQRFGSVVVRGSTYAAFARRTATP